VDVYVVSNVWAGQDAVVIGAGADLPGAEQVADRAALPDGIRWDEWTETAEKKWVRVSRLIRNGLECRFDQEIICVPMAGWPDLNPVVKAFTNPPR
jgi:hypothetical protein